MASSCYEHITHCRSVQAPAVPPRDHQPMRMALLPPLPQPHTPAQVDHGADQVCGPRATLSLRIWSHSVALSAQTASAQGARHHQEMAYRRQIWREMTTTEAAA